MLSKTLLKKLYVQKRISSAEIAKQLKCSAHKVNYWLEKFNIPKRTISEAIYNKANPNGDPFSFRKPHTPAERFLYGLGIGLYWGEGTKRNKNSVRLGNSDPMLVKRFMDFLSVIYNVKKQKLTFGLQIFGDMNASRTLAFWIKSLGVHRSQFYKPIVTPHRGVGNYRRKTQYGVMTVYFNNKKLRDIICHAIEEQSMN